MNIGKTQAQQINDESSSQRLAAVGQALIDPVVGEKLSQTFRAMADPTRVRILHALTIAELPVCDIAQLVGISESGASHQLSLLRALRIVRRRKTGRHVYYALDDEHIRGLIVQGLAHQEHG